MTCIITSWIGMPCRLGTLLILMIGFGASAPALAHHHSGGPASGLMIPSLAHEQMQVVAAHRTEVLALADHQPETDPTFRRLRNFIALQHTVCLWGLMPGSVADEASPFNECTHAELAAVKALLLHMTDMRAAHAAARALEDLIGDDARVAGFVLCQFSGEPFNTAEVIGPRWGDVPSHPPTLLACLAVLAFMISAATGVRARKKPSAPASPLPTA